MDWHLDSPQINILIPNPYVLTCGDGASKEESNIKWAHEGGALILQG